MAYVVAQPCIGTKDRACVEVCPVQCFYENEDQLLIHPEECIDCDACMPVCPVSAIFPEPQVPEEWKSYTQKAIDYFAENAGVPPAKSKADVGSGGVAPGSTRWTWKGQPAVAAKAAAPGAASPPAVEAPVAQPKPAPAPVAAMALAEPPEAPKPPTAAVHATVAAAPEPAGAPASPKSAVEAPAPPKAPEKPIAKPAPPSFKPMDPDEYRRIQALLHQVLEMLGGSRRFNMAVFSEAEETAKRLKKEVATEFGKDSYTVSELEKKGVTLRQKYELAQSLLQAVDRAQFIFQFGAMRRKFIRTFAGGVVTALISVVCGFLSLQSIRFNTLIINPNPGPLELLRGFLNPESFIPFLGLQTIAGLLGLFALFGLYQSWRLSRGVHELKRTLQAKQIDPRLIADVA